MVDEDIHTRNFIEKATSGILNLYEADHQRQQARFGEFVVKYLDRLCKMLGEAVPSARSLSNMAAPSMSHSSTEHSPPQQH